MTRIVRGDMLMGRRSIAAGLLLHVLLSACMIVQSSAFAVQHGALRTFYGTSADLKKALLVSRRTRGTGAASSFHMEISDEMRKRLEKENDAPLRLPLLGMGAVVGGKGFTDLGLTLIKGSMGMLVITDQTTMLGIDVGCMTVGIGIILRASGVWRGCAYNPTCWSFGKPWFLEEKKSP